MRKQKPAIKLKKIANQLELDFTLKSGKLKAVRLQMEFDFFNEEHNFFCQLYSNKGKLKVDLLRFFLADRITKSRKPVRRVLLFNNERTRTRVARAHRAVLKKHDIETATIQ